jgi:predicted nucleic acid-binding protein
VLLDTSYVVEALIGSQPLHDAALDFLVRLEEARRPLVGSARAGS